MESLADVEVSDEAATDAIGATVVIKLNGGLGTSMGMDRAKSLLCVRRGLSFLDVIARQVLHLRREYGATLPLIFMNSFRTSADTLAALARYDDLAVDGLPLEFLQNKEPKLRVNDLTPGRLAARPDAGVVSARPRRPLHRDEGAPACFDQLIDAGYRYAFVSNSDNLGAVPDARVAGWFAQSGAPFAIEAVRRTASDRKGGHFARRKADGRIVLRETAQTAEADKEALADLDAAQVLLDQQPVVRPGADARRARPPRRHPRPAADPQREERRPERPDEPEGDPDRDRDGRGDRGLRRLPHDRGRPRPVRAGQDDQRPAGAALRRLRPRPGLRARPGRRARCRSSTSTTLYKLVEEFDKRFPAGVPVAEGGRVAGRARATGPSARASRSWARPSSTGDHGRVEAGTVLGEADHVSLGSAACLPTRTRSRSRSRTTSNGCSTRIEPMPPFEHPLMDAIGLPVAEDMHAPVSLPVFDNSGMDGYAVVVPRRRRRHRRAARAPAGGRRDRRRADHDLRADARHRRPDHDRRADPRGLQRGGAVRVDRGAAAARCWSARRPRRASTSGAPARRSRRATC